MLNASVLSTTETTIKVKRGYSKSNIYKDWLLVLYLWLLPIIHLFLEDDSKCIYGFNLFSSFCELVFTTARKQSSWVKYIVGITKYTLVQGWKFWENCRILRGQAVQTHQSHAITCNGRLCVPIFSPLWLRYRIAIEHTWVQIHELCRMMYNSFGTSCTADVLNEVVIYETIHFFIHLRDMKYTVHDLEVMGLNPGHIELRMHSTFVYIVLEPSYVLFCDLYNILAGQDAFEEIIA